MVALDYICVAVWAITFVYASMRERVPAQEMRRFGVAGVMFPAGDFVQQKNAGISGRDGEATLLRGAWERLKRAARLRAGLLGSRVRRSNQRDRLLGRLVLLLAPDVAETELRLSVGLLLPRLAILPGFYSKFSSGLKTLGFQPLFRAADFTAKRFRILPDGVPRNLKNDILGSNRERKCAQSPETTWPNRMKAFPAGFNH